MTPIEKMAKVIKMAISPSKIMKMDEKWPYLAKIQSAP
jgi:hypothetical protein